ncbi:MAG: hypothetical protein F6K47_15870 [Symploca sp. SIO2E6]|nr:hypothetical protein [Symploca sp. SIO2E6]
MPRFVQKRGWFFLLANCPELQRVPKAGNFWNTVVIPIVEKLDLLAPPGLKPGRALAVPVLWHLRLLVTPLDKQFSVCDRI